MRRYQSLWESTCHWLTHAQAGDKIIQCKRQEKWSIYIFFTPRLNRSQLCQIFKTLTMTEIDELDDSTTDQWFSSMTWLCHQCVFDTTWVYETSNSQTSKTRNWGTRHHKYLHHKSMATSNQFKMCWTVKILSFSIKIMLLLHKMWHKTLKVVTDNRKEAKLFAIRWLMFFVLNFNNNLH